MDKVTPADIEALIEIFDSSDWSELRLDLADFRIHLAKDPARRAFFEKESISGDNAEIGGKSPDIAQAQEKNPDSQIEIEIPEGHVLIRAPHLGTFYRAPKPGAKPFVSIGQRVDPDTEVCLIEVMKLFTAIRAGVRGVIRKVLADDGQMVEFDQPLILIELES